MKHLTLKRSWAFLRYPVFIFCVVFSTYALSNLPAFAKKTSFWLASHFLGGQVAEASSSLVFSSKESKLNVDSKAQKIVADNHLVYPRLGIDVPVQWQINDSDNSIQAALKDGVVNVARTALPGQSGNVFITGHSSNYIWSPGEYKTAFALLGNSKADDLIYIKYQEIFYVYKVNLIRVVDPSDTSVMDNGDQRKLTLMTCAPLGTSINRLIIDAVQISTSENIKNQSSALPAGNY